MGRTLGVSLGHKRADGNDQLPIHLRHNITHTGPDPSPQDPEDERRPLRRGAQDPDCGSDRR